MLWPGGEIRRLVSLVRPSTPLPPDTSRLRALANGWPLWRPGLLYDGYEREDLRPLFGGLFGDRASEATAPVFRRVRATAGALANGGDQT
jgi:hypothetical protein